MISPNCTDFVHATSHMHINPSKYDSTPLRKPKSLCLKNGNSGYVLEQVPLKVMTILIRIKS